MHYSFYILGPIQRDHPFEDHKVIHEIQLAFHLVGECVSVSSVV